MGIIRPNYKNDCKRLIIEKTQLTLHYICRNYQKQDVNCYRKLCKRVNFY